DKIILFWLMTLLGLVKQCLVGSRQLRLSSMALTLLIIQLGLKRCRLLKLGWIILLHQEFMLQLKK
ncbi:hypothetical protein UB23_05320, partial [Pseudomonas sp. ES3-33]